MLFLRTVYRRNLHTAFDCMQSKQMLNTVHSQNTHILLLHTVYSQSRCIHFMFFFLSLLNKTKFFPCNCVILT